MVFKKYFLFFCVAMCLVGCAQPRYTLVTDTEFKKIIEKYDNLPYKRYVIVPTEKYKDKEEVNSLLQNTYDLLKRKDFETLKTFLSGFNDKSHGCYIYAQALLLLFQSNMSDALSVVEYINVDDCGCYTCLLKADLYSEYHKNNHYNESLKLYQKAIDCADESIWKEIIRSRIRLLRYQR